MRRKAALWFETKVKYEKTMDDGKQKAVSEKYTVEALSFTEAEAAITKELMDYVSGEFAIKAIAIAPYSEVFFSGDGKDDRWFKAKLAYIVLDERTGKEKKEYATYLVQADTLEAARKNIDEVMTGTMMDYTVAAIVETSILEVFSKD